MSIPLPDLLRRHRANQWRRKLAGRRARLATGIWSALARRPRLYHLANRAAVPLLHRLGRRRGAIGKLPLAGGWTASRELPAPQSGTFMQQWKKRGRNT